MKQKIWLSPPHMGGGELKFINSAFTDNWIAPVGPNIDGFEKDLSEYLNIDNVVVLSSGTAAIHLALITLGVKDGDYVLCSSFTFAASANPIRYLGANPVFIDAETDSWNMCPQLLEQSIQDLIQRDKKPAAIILTHLYGMPARMVEIMNLAKRHEIPVIEDAAEALGSHLKDKKLGTYGDIGILSFNGNKIITTSGGGALISSNEKYVDHARFLATQARDNAPHYEHSYIGYNYRMSNIIAGIGRGQMEVLEDRVKQRRNVHAKYMDYLSPVQDAIFSQNEWSENCFSNFWLTGIIFNEGFATREKVRLALEKENIEARPLWKPLHLQAIFSDCLSYLNGSSEEMFAKGLCLPSGSNLKDFEILEISKIIMDQI